VNRFAPSSFFTLRDVMKAVFNVLLITLMGDLLVNYLSPKKLWIYHWILLGLGTIQELVKECVARRTVELIFDTANKQVLLTYRSLFTEPEKRKLPFEFANFEYKINESWIPGNADYRIYLLKNKMEVFEISCRKDRFTRDELESILAYARLQGLPVKEY
jgi:hypothetical protein